MKKMLANFAIAGVNLPKVLLKLLTIVFLIMCIIEGIFLIGCIFYRLYLLM